MANEPGNGWTATHFARHAEKLAAKYFLKCKIFDKAKMKRLGMGGILAVNQGSAEPPKLVVLEYIPETNGQNGQNRQTIMLVGKGLTFDSGGISIKPAAGMQDMKYDMCGGAAVLAAMQAIAVEKPPVHVVALIPATDNMLGGSAFKPGDIIRHYNGLTSEIMSTDAEGRLILADALAYGVEEFKPDWVVDVATLTGAVIFGLGHHYTAILSNNDQLVEQLVTAGKTCGEPLWRLPLGREYTKQIESQVADLKNTGGRPGGTITAAAYLEKFIGETPWAHLDIAGTAWDFTEKTYIPKGPSGVAVRTLLEFIRNQSSSV
jgi:leucyl aminopeptidase